MRGFFTHFQATFYLYLFCTGGIFFANANNNPFPTSGNYNTHIKPSNYPAAALTKHASDFYDLWKNEYLKSDCGDYYVWVKDNKKTVSEAHGYGMMLTAYFAGHDANAKSYFDGLYNYFRKNRSITSPDLMDWEQKTCNDAASSNDNSASDGDIDIAYALLLAHVQWGSSGSINYLEEARKVINAVMQHDVNHETWTVKLGDWSTKANGLNYYYATRTSDFIPSHFRAFSDATGNDNWNKVIDKCYALIETMQTKHASTTGLMPDFIINTNTTPKPAEPKFLEGDNDGEYYYNACRNAWRLGVDYLLNGETKDLNAVKKLNSWLSTSTSNNPSDISNGYKLDGSKIFDKFNDATFVGPFTVGGMLDSSRQNWLNSLYSLLYNYDSSNLSGNYYADTIKLLSLLSISGNYWAPPKEKIQPTQATTGPTHGKYVVGYYAQWAIYDRDYNVSDIDGSKLTHLMYAFYNSIYDSATDTGKIFTLDDHADYKHTEDPGVNYGDTPAGNIRALKLLKDKYPHLKILMSLGGWTRSQHIPNIAKSANARKTYVESMVKHMQDYSWIDGFDIDWEFPVEGGTDGNETLNGSNVPAQPHFADDHKNLVYLLKEMRTQFDVAFPNEHKWVTMAGGNNVRNLLSTHVGPGNQTAHGMTENIATYSDFITFFGYDFGGNWFDETCYNAPLYPSNNPEDPLYRTQKDPMYTGSGVPQQALDDLITLYLDHLKIPKEKLVMGIPFYGKLFEIDNITNVHPNNPGLYESAPRTSGGGCTLPQAPKGSWDAGTCEQSGSIAFADLSQGVATNKHNYLDANDFLKVSSTAAANGWVRYWDNVAKVPYLYNAQDKKFISYDDPESIKEKVNYSLQRDLGGVMIWELSEDSRNDFAGQTFTTGGALLGQINTSLVSIKVDISVQFKDQNATAIDGVSVTLLDNQGAIISTGTSDASGSVTFSQVAGYKDYKITYQKANYGFLPAEKVIASKDVSQNLSYDIIGSNNLVTLSGITKLDGIATAVDVILLDDQNNELSRETSSSTGAFSFTNVVGGMNYNVTGEKQYYSFNTISLSNLTGSMSALAINGTIDTYTISGKVTDASGVAIGGVDIALSGGKTDQTQTASDGTYSFTSLDAGKNYTLTPSKGSLNFLPTNKTVTGLQQNTVVDFKQNEGYIFGTVKDGQNPLSGITVQLVLNWASNSLGHQSMQATTDSEGKYKFDDTQSGFKISDYAAFSAGGKIEIPSWLAKGYVFKPANYDLTKIPSTPSQYDFNTQLPAPKITIKKPAAATVTIAANGSVDLEAEIVLDPVDASVTINTVSFKVGGQTITPTKSGDIYTATWTPASTDYNIDHKLEVNATASNNETGTATHDFRVECSGTGCPNIKPNIVFNKPANSSYNQPTQFAAIPVEVNVTDKDGTVSKVTLSVNGGTATNMTTSGGGIYTHRFTPNSYGDYTLVVSATDDANETSTATKTVKVTNSSFVPLPSGNIILGFAHSWEHTAAPYLSFTSMSSTNYNVIIYSFIETTGNYYTPTLTINKTNSLYQTNGSFDAQKLKDDIQALRDQGIPVLVSIGGANAHVELTKESEKDIFVKGVIDIVNEFGFDGIDWDLEGGSMNFGAGTLTDFSNSSITEAQYPKLRYMIDAIIEIDDHFGDGFHLTSAPETYYVQTGYSTYADNVGSFLPVIHNIKDRLDLLMVQLYNTGSVNALDGSAYSKATPDFLTSMSDMLINGFNVASTGFSFPGLPASKIMVGIPSCPAAAPAGGYIKPSEAEKALNYLRFGTDFSGRGYTLRKGHHPDLRGVMTWSVNWDAASGCASEYEFSKSYHSYFNNNLSIEKIGLGGSIQVYPIPTEDLLSVNWSEGIATDVLISDLSGRQLFRTTHDFETQSKLQIDVTDLPSGVVFLQLKTTNGDSYVRRVIVK